MSSESQPGAQNNMNHPDEPPPFGRSWGRLYAAVLGWLAALILLFHLFSRRFAP